MPSPYRVWHGATGAGDGQTWTDAFTTYAAALVAATADGDEVWIASDHNGDAEVAADITWTPDADITVISVNRADDTYAPMERNGWLGDSAASFSLTQAIDATSKRLKLRGITYRMSGTSADTINIGGGTDGCHLDMEDVLAWSTNTNSSSGITIFSGSSSFNGFARLRNVKARLGHANQLLSFRGSFEWQGGGYETDGAQPTSAFATSQGFGYGVIDGVNLEHLNLTSGALTPNVTAIAGTVTYRQCSLPSGFDQTKIQAAQANLNQSGAESWLVDCSIAGADNVYGYANALGSMLTDTSVKLTAGVAQCSWKIITTQYAQRHQPFVTPWLARYHPGGGGAISPAVEIVRVDSSTAYTNAEVNGESAAKQTASSTLATFETDGPGPRTTPTNQGAGIGLGAWENEGGTAISLTIAGGSFSVTEPGDVRFRLRIGIQTTLNANPFVDW